jgi:hypothetical protein
MNVNDTSNKLHVMSYKPMRRAILNGIEVMEWLDCNGTLPHQQHQRDIACAHPADRE